MRNGPPPGSPRERIGCMPWVSVVILGVMLVTVPPLFIKSLEVEFGLGGSTSASRETFSYQVTLYSNGIPSRTWRSLGEPYPDSSSAGVWRFVNAETGQDVAVGGSVAIEHLPDKSPDTTELSP